MPQWMTRLSEWFSGLDDIAVAAILFVVVTGAVYAVVWGTLRIAERAAARTENQLDDELLSRIAGPARVLGPLVGVHAAAAWMGATWVFGTAEILEALILTYFAIASIEILVIETWLKKKQGIEVPSLVRQLVISLVYGAVCVGIAGEVFEVDLTPLLATGSVTTVVLGLALQGPLSNLFAGIVLHVERHPKPGEWLLIDGREGELLEIGWRTARLRMFTDDVIAVPNASLLAATVVNFTYPTPLCGRTVPVPVPLDVPPHVFDQWMRDVLRDIPFVVHVDEPRTRAWLVAIDDHCLRYNVRFWVSEFRRHDDAESEFLKGLWYRFQREGVAWPTPHQAVKLVEQPEPAFAGLLPARAEPFPKGRP